MSGWSLSRLRRYAAAAAAATPALLLVVSAHAQTRNLFSPQPTVPGQLTPGTGSPGPAPAAPAQAQVAPVVPAGHVALVVAARYGRDAPLITGGVIWRVYAGQGRIRPACFP